MSTIQSITDQFNITAQTLANLNNERSKGSLTENKIVQALGIQGKQIKEFRHVLSKLEPSEKRKLGKLLAQPETSKSHVKGEPSQINNLSQLEDAIQAGKVQAGDGVEIYSLNTTQGRTTYQITENSRGTIHVAQVPSVSNSLLISIRDLSPKPARLGSQNLLINTRSTNIDLRIIPK